MATTDATEKKANVLPSAVDDAELSADELQLRTQGHVGELPRQFSAFAAVALAFSITNSWVGYAGSYPSPSSSTTTTER